MLFYNRHEAGRLLAKKLAHHRGEENTLVMGLARGGVVVAFEVAKTLSLPLNVVVPRKIGAPGNSELALGSIMEDGEGVFNSSIIKMLGVSQTYLKQEIEKEKIRAHHRLTLYRQHAALPDIKGHSIILVDDGIATGSTMLASINAMRKAEAKEVVVAVPVSSTDAMQKMLESADEVVCLYCPEDFFGVGQFYSSFAQTDDEEVAKLLKEANK